MADGWVDETPEGGWAWETAVPGPDLARAVAGVDLDDLSGEARASLLKAAARLSGWVSMVQARATVAVVDAEIAAAAGTPEARRSTVHDWAADEVAAALRIAPRTAAARISAAQALAQRWPALGDAVATGTLTWAQALVIAEGIAILDGHPDPTHQPDPDDPSDPDDPADPDGHDLSDTAVDRILPIAHRYPPARLRTRLAALVLSLDPTAAARRRRRETRDRTDVDLWHEPDGLATVAIRGAAPDAIALRDAIHAHATTLATTARNDTGGGPARTIGQWRLTAAMRAFGLEPRGLPPAPDTGTGTGTDPTPTATPPLPTATPPGPPVLPVLPVPAPVQIRVTIDIATLLGLADDPAWLDGYGPLDPDLARHLATDADWQRWITDPVNGYLLDAGTRRYPSTRLARYIHARDHLCAHPTCGTRTTHCDIDHIPEYRHTHTTRADQLTLTCPRHNRSRDTAGWTTTPADTNDPYAGPEPTWTTPLHQTYRTITDPVLPHTTAPPGHAPPHPDPPDEPPY